VTDSTFAGFSEFHQAVARGSAWRPCVARLEGQTPSGLAAADLSFAPQVNVLWLVGLTRFERALDLGSPFASATAALSQRFEHADLLEPEELRASFARLRFAQDGIENGRVVRGAFDHLPIRADRYDCVLISDLDRAVPGGRRPQLLAVLEECRRVLREHGCLGIGLRNPLWYGRLSEGLRAAATRRRAGPGALAASKRIDTLRELLGANGFRDIRMFWCEPSAHRPQEIVPATRDALRSRRGTFRKRSRLTWLLSQLGWHACLYPSCLIFASP
jgi:SAM-dependent methyltransferase